MANQISIKKNFFYNILYQFLTMMIPLITTPYISRVLGADGVGIYSYTFSVANYFVLFIMLGINNYGNRTIAAVRENYDELSKNFSNIYFSQFVLGIIFSSAYLMYCLFITKDKIATGILFLYVVSGIIDINWFFYGLEQFKLTVTRNIVIKLLSTVCIFVFVKNKDDVYVYCLILASSFLISQIVIWPFLKEKIYFVKPEPKEIIHHLKPNLYLFSTVLAVSLFKIMDKIMLGMMTNNFEVGYYESSEKVINIPIAFVSALGTVMLPRITNMISEGKQNDKELTEISLVFAMLLSTSMCFGLMSIAPLFVPVFYGVGFEKCIDLFQVLLPSCVFLAFANVIRTQYLLPRKMDSVYVKSAFLGAAVNIISNAILIPSMQSMGAAIGTLLAEAFVCIYQCYHARIFLEFKKIIIAISPMLISGIIMYFVVLTLPRKDGEPKFIFWEILCGCLVYVVSLCVCCYPNRKYYLLMLKHMKSV